MVDWNSNQVDKIYQPLIEFNQPLIFFINGMLFDNYLLTFSGYYAANAVQFFKHVQYYKKVLIS